MYQWGGHTDDMIDPPIRSNIVRDACEAIREDALSIQPPLSFLLKSKFGSGPPGAFAQQDFRR